MYKSDLSAAALASPIGSKDIGTLDIPEQRQFDTIDSSI